MDVTVPEAPPLVNIHNVELIHTGTWAISTGVWTATREDLEAVIAALDCPAIRNPVIKIGHTDPRFDGEPAVGWLGNLAVTRDGTTLTCSYMGVPGWLAAADGNGNSVLTSAYPDRSIEGVHDFVCQIGHTHPFVLTGVALLGVTPPGVGTLQSLQDIAALYGVAASGPASGVPIRARVNTEPRQVSAAAMAHTGAMAALVPSDADARRLAVDGGEPAAELHATLMYLGDGADWDDDARRAAIDAVTQVVSGLGPVGADGFGLSMFNPDGDEPCIVLTLGGSALEDIHDAVLAAVTGGSVPEQRTPWIPHVTLTYTDDAATLADLTDRVGPVVFDRVRVAFAGDHTDISLTAATQAAAGGRSLMPNPRPTQVAAGVTTEDVRRQYYEDAPWSYWVTEFHLEPLQLIVVDDNNGKHYRVPVAVTGEDSFTFGDPVEVLVRYVDAPADAGQVSASTPIVYASRAESRPGDPPRAAVPPPDNGAPAEAPPPGGATEPATHPTPPTPGGVPVSPAAEPEPHRSEEDSMSLSEVRSRLGLPDDADDAAILAALDGVIDQATTPTPEPVAAAKPQLPPGVVTIEASVLAELRQGAAAGQQAMERQRTQDRDQFIAAAIDAGKFAPSRKEHWTNAYDKDPEGTRAAIDGLAEGLIPVAAAGYTGSPEPKSDDDEYAALVAILDGPTAKVGS